MKPNVITAVCQNRALRSSDAAAIWCGNKFTKTRCFAFFERSCHLKILQQFEIFWLFCTESAHRRGVISGCDKCYLAKKQLCVYLFEITYLWTPTSDGKGYLHKRKNVSILIYRPGNFCTNANTTRLSGAFVRILWIDFHNPIRISLQFYVAQKHEFVVAL